MELFHDDGHLTDAGLRALADEALDEMARLEAAEHLGFCDKCLLRYTALLSDDTLMQPEAPLAEGVLKSIRRKARRVLWSRYGTVVAAAGLALAMMGVGSLALPGLRAGAQAAAQAVTAPALPEARAPGTGLDERIDGALTATGRGLSDFFSWLAPKAQAPDAQAANVQAPEPPANSEAVRRQEEEKRQREKHNSVFAQKKPGAQNAAQPAQPQPDGQSDDSRADNSQ